jgi:hypothetical protein
MGFFLIIVIFQMFGMFAHRLMTLGHIVSSRHIRKFGKKKTFNVSKVIEQSGVSIMKDMIQNVEVNAKIMLNCWMFTYHTIAFHCSEMASLSDWTSRQSKNL